MVEEEIRTFDDLDIELNESLIRVFSTMLGIKRNVIIADREQWAVIQEVTTLREKEKLFKEIDNNYGHCDAKNGIIWLNPRLLKRQYFQLISTIIHELLHIANPNWSEDQVFETERKMTGRYDYEPLYRLGYDD